MSISLQKIQNLRRVFAQHGVVLGYLFGSGARGIAGPLSDIDVAVVFSQDVLPSEYFDRELAIAGSIRQLFGVGRVDVVNLETAVSPLLKHRAVFSGQPVLVGNERLRRELEHKVMQEYEDTRFLRAVQHHILQRQILDGTFGKAENYVIP